MIVKQASELEDFIRAVLTAAGFDEFNTDAVADHLVASNLAGIDTHGVWHIPDYIHQKRDGVICPTARPRIVDGPPQTAMSTRIRGENGLGHPIARFGMQTAIDQARQSGMAIVSLVELDHIGRLGHYCEMAGYAQLASIVLSSGFSLVTPRCAPFGGKDRVLDTNPLAVGIPLSETGDDGRCEMFLMDFATTALSGVKIVNARNRGEQLPPGSLIDKAGRPTTDPNDYFNGGAFSAFGGHKGYAIMLVAELLGAFFGNAFQYAEDEKGRDLFRNQGVTMIVFKADLFQPFESFTTLARTQMEKIRGSAPAVGFDRVMVPGDIERKTRAERLQNGIPIADDVWESVTATAKELGVTAP